MNNIIGNNIKLLCKRLGLSQEQVGLEMGRKEQAWVSVKLNGLGDDPRQLSKANREFIKDILPVLNKYSDYELTFEDVTELNFGLLSINEIEDKSVSIEQWVERVKERQPNLSAWIEKMKQDLRQKIEKVLQLNEDFLKLEKKERNATQLRNICGVIASILAIALLFVSTCCRNDKAVGAPCPNQDNPGAIYIEDFTTTTKEIDVCGYFCQFNESRRPWLFLNIVQPDGSVLQWPKGTRAVSEGDQGVIRPDQYGNWCATIFEFGSDQDTLFDLELISVDSNGHKEILHWMEEGFKTGHFPPFKFSSKDHYFSLDLIEGINTIKSPPEK